MALHTRKNYNKQKDQPKEQKQEPEQKQEEYKKDIKQVEKYLDMKHYVDEKNVSIVDLIFSKYGLVIFVFIILMLYLLKTKRI